MIKVLFIKSGLSIGGTTSSFLALLNALRNTEQIEVSAWVNGADKVSLPPHVNVIENTDLEYAFFRKKSTIGKVADLFRYRTIIPYLKSKIWKGRSQTTLIPVYQEMDIRKAKRVQKVDLLEFDVVITWEELYPAYLLSEAVKARRKIAWIHPDYIQCGFSPEIDKEAFAKLDRLIAVSEQGKKSMQMALPILAKKIRYIPNCVNLFDVYEKAKASADELDELHFTLMTVARLQNISKAIDRAVRIAGRLKAEGCRFKWYFVGDGEDRGAIEKMIVSLGLEDCVILLGEKTNPYPYIKAADLFVLQSYYEGKPVTVDEALILGTPVLVTDYASAKEQVDEQYGWIVQNDEKAIYQQLKQLIDHPQRVWNKKKVLKAMDASPYESPEMFITMLKEVILSC